MKILKTLLLALAIIATCTLSAQVAIKTDGSSADASAMLDIQSTSKGLLIPKMTEAQRTGISQPATGLLVYQTDAASGFYFNSGTPSSPNWTSLNQSERWTQSSDDIYSTNSGNVGIGTDSPDQKLSVIGLISAAFEADESEYISLNHNGNHGRVSWAGDGNLQFRYNGATLANVYQTGGFNVDSEGYFISGDKFLFEKYNSTIVGTSAGLNLTSDGVQNCLFGRWAGQELTSGNCNVFLGTYSGESNSSGAFNTYVGYSTGNLSTKNYNTHVGAASGKFDSTGYQNTCIGVAAGRDANSGQNVFIGYESGKENTGSKNVFIGYRSGKTYNGSDKLFIDNTATDTPLIWGDFANDRVVINGDSSNNVNDYTFFSNGAAGGTTAWTNDSDERLKKNIQTIPNALEKTLALRGVNYEWKNAKTHQTGLQMGFIAQESEKVIPEVVTKNQDRYSMSYGPVTALLVEALKEQQKTIEELQKRIEKLESHK